jgi:hypothetical protein
MGHSALFRAALHKQPQFVFFKLKYREPAIQANRELWKRPHRGLFQIFDSNKMDINLAGKIALIL